jgi:hypothetical protein
MTMTTQTVGNRQEIVAAIISDVRGGKINAKTALGEYLMTLSHDITPSEEEKDFFKRLIIAEHTRLHMLRHVPEGGLTYEQSEQEKARIMGFFPKFHEYWYPPVRANMPELRYDSEKAKAAAMKQFNLQTPSNESSTFLSMFNKTMGSSTDHEILIDGSARPSDFRTASVLSIMQTLESAIEGYDMSIASTALSALRTKLDEALQYYHQANSPLTQNDDE